jgi:DNA-binding MarR family transcriptional regulator
MQAAVWNGTSKSTDLMVIQVLLNIVVRCCKTEFGASVREVADGAHVSSATALRSLRRLADAGWLEKIAPARGERSTVWRLRVPPETGDQNATIIRALREGKGLSQPDPFFGRGDRAGSPRLVAPVPHDVFRWGKGLGAIKGRIYTLLERPLTATEIATLLQYKYVRDVRVHLRRLLDQGLVRRRPDLRFERCDGNLNEVAERLGVLGANERQRAQHAEERSSYHRWCELFERWKDHGEIVDPDTGEILATESIPHKRTPISIFRQRVLLLRSSRTVGEAVCEEKTTKISATRNDGVKGMAGSFDEQD